MVEPLVKMTSFRVRRPGPEDSLDETLGLACRLAAATPYYCSLSFMEVESWLAHAARHQRIAFAHDETDKPTAFVTWAHLAPDVVWRFQRWGRAWIHESEWNEGDALWIIDCASLHGRTLRAVRAFRRALFPGVPVAFMRWDRHTPQGRADLRP